VRARVLNTAVRDEVTSQFPSNLIAVYCKVTVFKLYMSLFKMCISNIHVYAQIVIQNIDFLRWSDFAAENTCIV